MEDGYLYDAIKVLQMPLFMIVSGYLCGIGRRAGSLKDYWKILKRRGLSYLVPFFFWIILKHHESCQSQIHHPENRYFVCSHPGSGQLCRIDHKVQQKERHEKPQAFV